MGWAVSAASAETPRLTSYQRNSDQRLLQGDVAPPGTALDFRVRRWRRFLELPLDHMLAAQPGTARGRFRVGVWLTPQMTGPQAARLAALHAQYYVGVLGFHEEQARRAVCERELVDMGFRTHTSIQHDLPSGSPSTCLRSMSWCTALQVYMYSHQLAHCLRDPDILKLVRQAQLKLVLIDSFPELFTFCPRGGISNDSAQAQPRVIGRSRYRAHDGDIESTISASEQVHRWTSLTK